LEGANWRPALISSPIFCAESRADNQLAQFALGDVAKKDQGGNGVVRAIFTTKDGDVVEKEGALNFVDETKIVAELERRLGRLRQESRSFSARGERNLSGV
jgi:hypothetical protein